MCKTIKIFKEKTNDVYTKQQKIKFDTQLKTFTTLSKIT